jgi:hypothetical protein
MHSQVTSDAENHCKDRQVEEVFDGFLKQQGSDTRGGRDDSDFKARLAL